MSYTHKNIQWKDELCKHLQVLEREGSLEVWDDTYIKPGETWEMLIRRSISVADVAVCLVTIDYLSSRFCMEEELPMLRERMRRDGLRIIPVLIEPVLPEELGFIGELQMLPGDGKSVAEYQNKARAFTEVTQGILRAIVEPPPQGWVDLSRLALRETDVFGRMGELQALDEAWESPTTRIMSIVGPEGIGKSDLLQHWCRRMASKGYRGARVYGWSLPDRRGLQSLGSSDEFILEACARFGDPDPYKGAGWDKGIRLARLVSAEPTLLILENVEPLSWGTVEPGLIGDPALAALIVQLGRSEWQGLCVITGSERVRELEDCPRGTVRHIDLGKISDEAGRRLLWASGVEGAKEELEAACRACDNQTLAIHLLAGYLKDRYAGSANPPQPERRIGACDGLLGKRQGASDVVEHLLTELETYLGESAELQVLRLLALFEDPVERHTMDAVRQHSIAGLTDLLHDDERFQGALKRLRRLRLILPKSRPRSVQSAEAAQGPTRASTSSERALIECHRAIRLYFGRKLKLHHVQAWREGNRILHELFKQAASEEPQSTVELIPLYKAVAHARAAFSPSFAIEFYSHHVLRGEKFFPTQKLGAYGADLACLAGFFEVPWREPVSELNAEDHAFVLNQAGHRLRALGRFRDAIAPVSFGRDGNEQGQEWPEACIASINLSQLKQALGHLEEAEVEAKRAVRFGEKSGEPQRWAIALAALADVLHQAGKLDEAAGHFEKSEALLAQGASERSRLDKLAGCHYCELLLTRGQFGEVLHRASGLLDSAHERGDLLHTALAHRLVARAHLGLDHLALARLDADRALEHMGRAGTVNFLPLGWMAKAEVCVAFGNKNSLDEALQLLEGALELAERMGALLVQADAYVLFADVHRALHQRDRAVRALTHAERIVRQSNYRRRQQDLDRLWVMLDEAPIQ